MGHFRMAQVRLEMEAAQQEAEVLARRQSDAAESQIAVLVQVQSGHVPRGVIN